MRAYGYKSFSFSLNYWKSFSFWRISDGLNNDRSVRGCILAYDIQNQFRFQQKFFKCVFL